MGPGSFEERRGMAGGGGKNGTSSQSTRGESKIAILTLPMVEPSIYEFLRPSELVEIQGRRVWKTVLR